MPSRPVIAEIESFESRMDSDWNFAMSVGDLFFQDRGPVWATARKVAARLDDLGLPYAIAGGMALYKHGQRRVTEDVDILTTADGVAAIHEKLSGLGYLPLFAGSKNLRDTETGVRIEFLIAGQFPGDGLPKPLAFPDPNDVAVEIDGIRFIDLPTLVSLKLASGMTGGLSRLKDLADVVALIQNQNLRADFAEELHPYVRAKYAEMWAELSGRPSSGPGGRGILPAPSGLD